MGKYLTNTTLAKYREIVNYLRTDEIGKVVTLVSKAVQAFCNNCVWDPAGKRSSGNYNGTGPRSFTNGKCPVCKGTGKLGASTQTKPIKATCVWLKEDGRDKESTGINEGNRIRMRAPRGYLSLIKAAEYVIVDSVKFEIERPPMPVGFGIPQVSCECILRRSD